MGQLEVPPTSASDSTIRARANQHYFYFHCCARSVSPHTLSTMNALRCLRVAAWPTSMPATLLGPSTGRIASVQRYVHQMIVSTTLVTNRSRSSIPSTARSISLLAPRRPVLPSSSLAATLPTPGSTGAPAIPSADALDLASKISSHPALGSIQIRCGPRDTYNPSHFVRKRRHGFLSRIRTKKGRKLLMRRVKKGRWNLSH